MVGLGKIEGGILEISAFFPVLLISAFLSDLLCKLFKVNLLRCIVKMFYPDH